MAPSHKQPLAGQGTFNMVRYFSLASLVAIILAAVVLTLTYRQVAISSVIQVGENANLALARASLLTMQSHLLGYLNAARGSGTAPYVLPAELDRAIQALLRNTTVVQVKICDQDGTVLFSTRPNQIGNRQADNPGVASALGGKVASKLVYRDRLNHFDSETANDNLIQTYIPVQAGPTSPIQGVFEIYTDVNPMVRKIEEAGFLVLGGSSAVLLLLYAALLSIVRRAERIIEQQQAILRERSLALELLSSQLINAEEHQKKHVAHELHEGVAQTLAAIKLSIEASCGVVRNGVACNGSSAMQSMVPVIQDAIHEVRAIAIDLRPPSLDDLGAVAALSGYCRDFGAVYPQLRLEKDFDVDEADIPAALKVVIFRVVQQHLQDLARHTRASRVRLELGRANGNLVLTVRSDSPVPDGEAEDLRILRERVKLSGGSLDIAANDWNGSTITMAWPS